MNLEEIFSFTAVHVDREGGSAASDDTMNAMKPEAIIHCPHCEYRPQPEDRWDCVPSCGTIWNTFWTRGVCPGCGVKWPKTQCLACGQWSPHEAWYHYPPPDDEAERRLAKEPEKVVLSRG